jgi:TrmH family RNA methyltransferase
LGRFNFMPLTSPKNPYLQAIRRAIASGRTTGDGRIVIEGPHLLREAARSSWRIEQVLVTSNGRDRHSLLLSQIDAELIEIPPRAFESLAGTETSQEIMALVTPRAGTWNECLSGPGVTVIIDGVQDPGNAGTVARSAEAFGAAGLIFVDGSVHVANGKFLRATAGSIFRMPYLENQTGAAVMAHLGATGRKLYALMPQAAISLSQADLRQPCAIVVGSEAQGVSAELRCCAEALCIPTTQVESLNAGVACSIALFEAARQRGRV